MDSRQTSPTPSTNEQYENDTTLDALSLQGLEEGEVEETLEELEDLRNFEWLSGFEDAQGLSALDTFRDVDLVPPLSTHNLAELDVQSMIFNPVYRYDLNFYPNSAWLPTRSSSQSSPRRSVDEMYWKALRMELMLYFRFLDNHTFGTPRDSARWLIHFRRRQLRVPKIFESIRSVMLSLLPEEIHESVREALDVPLVMQRIEHGSFDSVELAESLSTMLKTQCAPPRDQMVESMVSSFCRSMAPEEDKSDAIVEGLQKLFGVFEAMKLDALNHQLISLGPVLIDATIHFAHLSEEEAILTGRFDQTIGLVHYEEMMTTYLPASSNNNSNIFNFAYCLVARVSEPYMVSRGIIRFPPTFAADQDRLRCVQDELQSLVKREFFVARLQGLMGSLGRSETTIREATEYFRQVVPLIYPHLTREASARHTACEIVRLGTTESVPRQFDRNTPFRPVASFDLSDLYQRTQDELVQNDRCGQGYQAVCELVRAAMLEYIPSMVEEFAQLSPRQLSDALVPRRGVDPPQSASSSSASIFSVRLDAMDWRDTPQFHDICRKITHVAVLHWQVWAPILYLRGTEDEVEEEDEDEEAGGVLPLF